MTTGPTPALVEAIGGTLDWDALFAAGRPRELEIGSGKGLFLLNAGRRHPDVDFVGIELARKYARRAAERLERHGLANVRVVWGDARRLLGSVPDRSVRAVHVYFPDPWWKKRHRKRRMFQPEFIAQAARVLVPGGRLEIATDVGSYFEEIVALMADSPAFATLPALDPGDPEHDLDYLTHFERKYRIEGRPIFRARYATRSDPPREGSAPCDVAP
jgi:tRNA (guanine-N7-)-methyltransferase